MHEEGEDKSAHLSQSAMDSFSMPHSSRRLVFVRPQQQLHEVASVVTDFDYDSWDLCLDRGHLAVCHPAVVYGSRPDLGARRVREHDSPCLGPAGLGRHKRRCRIRISYLEGVKLK